MFHNFKSTFYPWTALRVSYFSYKIQHSLTIFCSSPHWARACSFTRFLNHTQRHTTVGRTPLDEWSARRRDLYLTSHNTQTSTPPMGFEAIMSADERPQTYALDRAATGTGRLVFIIAENSSLRGTNWILYKSLSLIFKRLHVDSSWQLLGPGIHSYCKLRTQLIYNSSLLSWREETL